MGFDKSDKNIFKHFQMVGNEMLKCFELISTESKKVLEIVKSIYKFENEKNDV